MTNKITVPSELIHRAIDAIEQVGYQDKFIDYTFVGVVKNELRAALADPVPPNGGEPDQIITLQQKINLLRYHLSDYEFEWEKARVQRLAGWYCPECGRNKEVGHSDKCELAQALKPLKTDEDFQQFREYIAEVKKP